MRQILILAVTAFIFSGCVANQNVPLPYNITEALEHSDYKARLQDIRFYFGNEPHPAVAKSFGISRTAQRSSAVERGRKETCARAFASAMLRLRSAALKAGGDAVINIKSNYKDVEVSSENNYQCATGALMSGVALKGTVVKLR